MHNLFNKDMNNSKTIAFHKNKKLIVSLFCGIGGLDLGFEAAGFEIALAIDNNPKVLAAYQKNFSDTLTLCADIANLNTNKIKGLIHQKYPKWNGVLAAVIGGPPCQPFSAVGKQNPNDERNQLIIKSKRFLLDILNLSEHPVHKYKSVKNIVLAILIYNLARTIFPQVIALIY